MKDLFTVAGQSKIRQKFTGSNPDHDTGQGKGRFSVRNSGKNSGILALTNPKSGTRVLTEVGCVPRLAIGVSVDLAMGVSIDSATGVGVDFGIEFELKTGAFTCVGSGSGTDVRRVQWIMGTGMRLVTGVQQGVETGFKCCTRTGLDMGSDMGLVLDSGLGIGVNTGINMGSNMGSVGLASGFWECA